MVKKDKHINESLSDRDMEVIRILIRKEISKIFFDLYRKRQTWIN